MTQMLDRIENLIRSGPRATPRVLAEKIIRAMQAPTSEMRRAAAQLLEMKEHERATIVQARGDPSGIADITADEYYEAMMSGAIGDETYIEWPT